jgi:cytidylate kinase
MRDECSARLQAFSGVGRAESLRYTRGLVTEQKRTRKVIAIDGPSGVGKGTVARAVADAFGYRHVDTGAMYRALAWRVVDSGIDLEDEPAVSALAGRADLVVANGQVSVDGVDVTSAIRTPQIDRAVTSVARMPSVRALLVARQRALGRDGGVVMEGRDIGTVVFPDADVKIYLDASPEERARRRAADPAHGGRGDALATVASAMADRDRIDSTRAVSPLTIAPDAIVVDTTGISVPDVVAKVKTIIDGTPPR